MLGIIFLLPVASGFLAGFFAPTRVIMLCLVPVAVIVANFLYAMAFHGSVSVFGVLIGIVIAYPTAYSINRFMHD